MSALSIAGTAPVRPVMVCNMKRPRPPSMFRQVSKPIARGKGGHRASIGSVTIGPDKGAPAGKELVGFTSNIAGPLKWAKTILRRAGLPIDLRSRTRPDGTTSIVLLDDSLVTTGTLEWRAARVVFYATTAANHIKSGNAADAAYCANLATEHFWRGWLDDAAAPFLRTGDKIKRAARVRGDAILREGITDKTARRYSELLAERPGESQLEYCRLIGEEFGVDKGTIRKRLQRHLSRIAGT